MVERLGVQIRHLTESDLPALEWEGRFKHFRRLYQRGMEDAKQGRTIMLVAEHEERIVGQIFIQLRGGPPGLSKGLNSGYLYSFRVRPEVRNHGVGTQLMERAEDELRALGFGRAVIAVAQDNSDALRLYERMGYRRIGEDPGEWAYTDHLGRIRWVSEPAFVLEKRI